MEATPALLQDAPDPTAVSGPPTLPRRTSPRARSVFRAVLNRLLVVLAWSMGCVYLLNTSTFVGRADSGYISTNLVALAGIAVDGIWASLILVSVVVLFLGAVTGRLWIGLVLVLDLCLLLGAVNAVKLRVRAEPVSPSDLEFLSTPGFLADMVPTWTLIVAAAAMLAVPLVVFMLARRRARLRDLVGRRAYLVGRAVLVLACGAALLTAPGFNQPGNLWRAVFDADVNRWAHWSQHENFMVNGFVGGLLYDMPVEPMAAPAGYTRDNLDRIEQTPTERKGRRRLEARDIDLLAVSCTVPVNLPGAARCVAAARAVGLPVLVGGRAFAGRPQRAEAIGADGLVTAPQELLEPPPAVGGDVRLSEEALRLDVVSDATIDQVFARAVAADPRIAGLPSAHQDRTREDLRWITRFTGAAVLTGDPTVLDDFLASLLRILARTCPGRRRARRRRHRGRRARAPRPPRRRHAPPSRAPRAPACLATSRGPRPWSGRLFR